MKKIQSIEVTEEMLKDETNNLLLNMSGGLLPENLSKRETALLEKRFGKDWFYILGYNDQEYKNPTTTIPI